MPVAPEFKDEDMNPYREYPQDYDYDDLRNMNSFVVLQ